MNFTFHFLICIGLVVCRTAVLPVVFGAGTVYDILLPQVVFLGLNRPFREGLPVVVFAGVLMDTVSGGPIGLFVTVYLWFFLGIFILVGVVHVTNRWLGAGVILAGVVIESAAIAAVQAIAPAPLRFGPGIVAVVVVELIQAAATGMILLWCIGRLFGRWETVTTWVADYLEERRMKW